MAADSGYLPALRWKALTPVFDSVVRVTSRERAMKQRLLDQAGVAPGDSVLDLGAGTGTLAIRLKQRCPEATVTGLDADPDVLARARRKASDAQCEIDFVEGFSTELPFANESFDVILSSLFFHHLMPADKRRTLAEVRRVLKPGGRLHVADWGKPARPADGRAVPLRPGIRRLRGHCREPARSPARPVREAGLQNAQERRRLRTTLGTLALYSARKPA